MVLEEAQDRLDQKPDAIRMEELHPFGVLKTRMRSIHFLTKTLDHVSTEVSVHVLAYNVKWTMNIIGMKPLIGAIGASSPLLYRPNSASTGRFSSFFAPK